MTNKPVESRSLEQIAEQLVRTHDTRGWWRLRMERIEDLCHPDAPQAQYRNLTVAGRAYVDAWLPSLPLPMFTLRSRLADAWAVWNGHATAVQWPHQRKPAREEER